MTQFFSIMWVYHADTADLPNMIAVSTDSFVGILQKFHPNSANSKLALNDKF